MKIISDYSIYCTPEQVKKAMKLGVPLGERWDYDECGATMPFEKEIPIEFHHLVQVPTAEQMIGWLEEQEDIKEIYVCKKPYYWRFAVYYKSKPYDYNDDCVSRKEATLAAIDLALEYLTNNKK